MESPNPSELHVSKLEALPLRMTKRSSSTNTNQSNYNNNSDNIDSNHDINHNNINKNTIILARQYVSNSIDGDTSNMNSDNNLNKNQLINGPTPPLYHPTKHQHNHTRRFISQQFERSSTYPVNAPFHTTTTTDNNYNQNTSDVLEATKQVEAYSQLFPSNGVPLRILQMGDNLSKLHSTSHVHVTKAKRKKNYKTEKNRDFVANELEVFEGILNSFLKQSIGEKEFFNKFERQRADTINLETKKSFIMLRSLYEVILGTTRNISKNNINMSIKVISQLACKLLSAEYARVSQNVRNSNSNNNKNDAHINNNNADTRNNNINANDKDIYIERTHESAFIKGKIQTVVDDDDDDVHYKIKNNNLIDSPIHLNINIKKRNENINRSMYLEATRVSKLVYKTGTVLNLPRNLDVRENLGRESQKAVLCVPIKDTVSTRGTIAVIGKQKLNAFSKFDIFILNYLANLVTLVIKTEGQNAGTQTICNAKDFDTMFRVFRTDAFARELEDGNSLLDLYFIIQKRFEHSLHDASVSVLLFIDPENEYQLAMFNLKTRSIVPVAPTTFINIIMETKKTQFLAKDVDVDFTTTNQDITTFAEKIDAQFNKSSNFIVGIPCINDTDGKIMAIVLSSSEIILPASQINAALDAAFRAAPYISNSISTREKKLREIRERANIEEKLRATEEELNLIKHSMKHACEIIANPVDDGNIWACAKSIESAIRNELKADEVKVRFVRMRKEKGDNNDNNSRNEQVEMVYLREHESFGSKIIVEEITNLKESIINEAFETGDICIYQKRRQENSLIRNKFQHMPTLLNVDEEWVTDKVHQLCCIPLSKNPIKKGNGLSIEGADNGERQRCSTIIAIALVRGYASMAEKWEYATKSWLKNFCSIIGPWLAGHVTINNVTMENKLLKESQIRVNSKLKILCKDVENGLYNPRTDDLLHLAALSEISLNTEFIAIYEFKEEPKSKFGTISWLFKKAYAGDDNGNEKSTSAQMKLVVRYPKDVRSQYKSFSLDSTTINLVKETGKLVTKSIDIIDGITTIVHVSPMTRGKHDVFGLCVFVQEIKNRIDKNGENNNGKAINNTISHPVTTSSYAMDKEMFRLCTNAFTACSKRLNSMKQNSQLVSNSKEMFEIWDNAHENFDNFSYLVENIIDKFTKLFDAEDVTIYVANEKDNYLWVPPMTDQPIAVPYVLPLKSVVAGHSIIKGKLLNVKDMETCFFESLDAECHDENIGRKPYKTLMACPIFIDEENIFGAIEITNKLSVNDDNDKNEDDPIPIFTDDDSKLLTFLTSLVGRGIYYSYCKNEKDLLELVKQGIERVASMEEEAAEKEREDDDDTSG